MEKQVKQLISDVIYGMNVPIIKSTQGRLPDKPDTPSDPDVPLPEDPDTPEPKYMYIGTLDLEELGIGSMSDITSDHVVENLTKRSDGIYNKEAVQTKKYDIIVVAVLQNRTAYIDDGLGGKTAFYTNYPDRNGDLFYANGDVTCQIDDNLYKLYGVLTSAPGTNYIYIE